MKNFSNESKNYFILQNFLADVNKFIRQLFLESWQKKFGSIWTDDKNAVDNMKSLKERTAIYSRINKDQKKYLEEGDSNQWDISLLYLLFDCLGFERKIYIQKIKDIRNKLAHCSNMSFSDEEYDSIFEVLKSSLTSLGYSEPQLKLKIQEIKNIFANSDEEKNETISLLKEQANKSFDDKDYTKAIDLYTQAISIPNKNNTQTSILYLNRSLGYLKVYEDSNEKQREKYLYKALSDSKQAGYLNPSWFKAYARLGQIYKELNDLESSIENYNNALILDPGNEEIKNALALVKHKRFEQNRRVHLDPHNLMLKDEQSKRLSEKISISTGLNINELLPELRKKMEELDPSLSDVWKGHDYRVGSNNCQQDYEKAAFYYSKAAKKGNAEGIYNLAILTQKGLGVNPDFKLAFGLLKEAANKPPTIKQFSREVPNVGVAEAEHSLGIAYQEGIYVSKSCVTAAIWYQRAIDHGNSFAANNLGLLYMYGQGVDRDLDRAESLFLLSHKRGCLHAMVNLVDLYLMKQDPDRALFWHNRAREENYLIEVNRHDDVMKEINKQKDMENKLKSNLKDLSLGQKLEKIQEKIPFLKEMKKLKLVKGLDGISKFNFDIEILYEHAEKGSQYAAIMFEAMIIYYDPFFEFISNKDKEFYNFNQAILKLAEAIQKFYLVCQIPLGLKEFISEKCEEILKNKKNDELDLSARICYMFMKMSDMKPTINFITESLRIYPNNCFMLDLRGSLNCFLKNYTDAILDFNRILEIDKENYDALYSKAAALRLNEKSDNFKQAIKLYELFIKLAPKDHRKVPESYYAIGYCKIMLEYKKSNHKSKNDRMLSIQNIGETFLKKGKEAEKLQLPCFLPYESNTKTMINMFLNSQTFDTSVIEEELTKDKQDSECKDLTFLKNKLRTEVIKTHRNCFNNNLRKMTNSKYNLKISIPKKPPRSQQMPKSLIGLNKIFLKDIDWSKDHVLEEHVVESKIFDIPIFGLPSVHFVVEDEKNYVEKLCVYNLGNNDSKISSDFKVGTWISIINPYIRMAADGKPMIRVDDPNTIVFSGHCVEKMCRYCGKENSKFNCAKCMKAFYCSKECQVNDWKLLDHKFVCF